MNNNREVYSTKKEDLKEFKVEDYKVAFKGYKVKDTTYIFIPKEDFYKVSEDIDFYIFRNVKKTFKQIEKEVEG